MQLNYQRPTTVAQAAQLLGSSGDARALAGGQSLLPSIKLGLASPELLVDLGALPELTGITVGNGQVRIGAMVTHAAVAASAEVQQAIPALAVLAGGIGDRQVRNRGTIGGSLANNDPAACYPAAVLGLGATVHTNVRQISADSFFKGLYETELRAGEIITSVSFPVPEKAAYVKFRQPASRFSIVGVFLAKTAAGVRVAVTGAGATVFRSKPLEDALNRSFTPTAVDGVTVPAQGLNNDLHATAEYRAHLIPVMARRAVSQA